MITLIASSDISEKECAYILVPWCRLRVIRQVTWLNWTVTSIRTALNTLCHKKVPTFKLSVTLSNLYQGEVGVVVHVL